MKFRSFILPNIFLLLSLCFISCEREELPENPYNPASLSYNGGGSNNNNNNNSGSGSVIFWSNFYGSPISVYVEGTYKGQITSYQSSAPDCGKANYINLSMAPGTYSYEAEDDTYSWVGTITISANSCLSMLLKL